MQMVPIGDDLVIGKAEGRKFRPRKSTKGIAVQRKLGRKAGTGVPACTAIEISGARAKGPRSPLSEGSGSVVAVCKFVACRPESGSRQQNDAMEPLPGDR